MLKTASKFMLYIFCFLYKILFVDFSQVIIATNLLSYFINLKFMEFNIKPYFIANLRN